MSDDRDEAGLPKNGGEAPPAGVANDAPTDDERAAREAKRQARVVERAVRVQVAALRPRLTDEQRLAREQRRRSGIRKPATLEERRQRRQDRLAATSPAKPKSETTRTRLPIEPIYEDADLAISRMGDPAARRVVLCFAGVGGGGGGKGRPNARGMGGIQPAEFVGSSQIEDSCVLHIADIQRTWFNGFEPERLLDVLRPLVDGRRIVSLGNSMGGFGAVWITKFLPVDVAMAFVPQFSVNPEIVPREKRWRQWTSRIEHWRAPSLADCFVPETRYFTFNGDGDFRHWRNFRPAPNADHFVLVHAGHQAAEKMKGAGVLGDVIRACVDGGDPEAAMKAGGLDVHRLGA